MKITNKCVASFHYTLTNASGEVIDSSEGRDPLGYLHGASNIVPGLEKELEGKAAGDKLSVVVKPEDGYGQYDENLKQELPRSMFSGVETIEAGMEFHAQTQNGMQVVSVSKVDGDNITVDGNHPLAGQDLHFDVEITEVRDATEEEIEHGHVHGEGGHEH